MVGLPSQKGEGNFKLLMPRGTKQTRPVPPSLPLHLRLGVFDSWGLPVQDAIAHVNHFLGLASFFKGWLQLHCDVFTHWGKETQHSLLSASEPLTGAGSRQNRPEWTPLRDWVESMLGAEKGVSTRPPNGAQEVKAGSKIHCPLSTPGPYSYWLHSSQLLPAPHPHNHLFYLKMFQTYRKAEMLKEYNE